MAAATRGAGGERDRVEAFVGCASSGGGFEGGLPLRAHGTRVEMAQPVSSGRFTTIASWLLRAMTTTASVSGEGFSSRCRAHGGTKT